MKEILENLALIDLNKFCKEHWFDYSGTHLVKNGRGFCYSLVKENTGRAIVSVTFHKSSVPTYYVHREDE